MYGEIRRQFTVISSPIHWIITKMSRLKTRQELIEEYESEFLDLVSMTIDVDGSDERLQYTKDMEDPPQRLHFHLPEYCTYRLSIGYKVKKRPLQELTYVHEVRRLGIAVNSRRELIAAEAPVNDDDNPVHFKTFSPTDLPGGIIVRGKHPASASFLEGNKTLYTCKMTIEITKKSVKPRMGGYGAEWWVMSCGGGGGGGTGVMSSRHWLVWV